MREQTTTWLSSKNLVLLMIVGAVLALAGWGMGGSIGVYWEDGSFHAIRRPQLHTVSVSETLSAFTSMRLEIIGDVEVVESDNFWIEAAGESYHELTYRINHNGVLHVTNGEAYNRITGFNFSMGFGNMTRRGNAHRPDLSVRIGVPAGTVFEHVNIEHFSGRMSVSDVSANHLELNSFAGTAILRNVSVANSAHLQNFAGTLDAAGDFRGDVVVQQFAGNVAMHLPQDASAYSHSVTRFAGSVSDLNMAHSSRADSVAHLDVTMFAGSFSTTFGNR